MATATSDIANTDPCLIAPRAYGNVIFLGRADTPAGARAAEQAWYDYRAEQRDLHDERVAARGAVVDYRHGKAPE